MVKVAILGGSGYTALELIKILLRHPQVEIAGVTTREGTPPIADLHPSLTGRLALRCESFDADRLVARLHRRRRRLLQFSPGEVRTQGRAQWRRRRRWRQCDCPRRGGDRQPGRYRQPQALARR